MKQSVTVKETKFINPEYVDVVYTYEQIEELFGDDPNGLVMQLLKRVIRLEEDNDHKRDFLLKLKEVHERTPANHPVQEVVEWRNEVLRYVNSELARLEDMNTKS